MCETACAHIILKVGTLRSLGGVYVPGASAGCLWFGAVGYPRPLDSDLLSGAGVCRWTGLVLVCMFCVCGRWFVCLLVVVHLPPIVPFLALMFGPSL